MDGKCLDQSFLRALGGSLGATPTHSHPKAGPCLGVWCIPLDTDERGGLGCRRGAGSSWCLEQWYKMQLRRAEVILGFEGHWRILLKNFYLFIHNFVI